jgi:hypothetical protein
VGTSSPKKLSGDSVLKLSEKEVVDLAPAYEGRQSTIVQQCMVGVCVADEQLSEAFHNGYVATQTPSP